MSEFGKPQMGAPEGPSEDTRAMVDTIAESVWRQADPLRTSLEAADPASAAAAQTRADLIDVLTAGVEELEGLFVGLPLTDKLYIQDEIDRHEAEIEKIQKAAWAKSAAVPGKEEALLPVVHEAGESRRRWLIGGGIAVGLLALLGGAAWWLTKE